MTEFDNQIYQLTKRTMDKVKTNYENHKIGMIGAATCIAITAELIERYEAQVKQFVQVEKEGAGNE